MVGSSESTGKASSASISVSCGGKEATNGPVERVALFALIRLVWVSFKCCIRLERRGGSNSESLSSVSCESVSVGSGFGRFFPET